MHGKVRVLMCVCSVVLTLIPAGTLADGPCSASSAYNGTLFNYERCQIPDVDQLRVEEDNFTPGLPNNGKMYCAPTSALDVMAYIANHGYPSVKPGAGYWGPEGGFPPFGQYNTMTESITTMGVLMGTSSTEGTNINSAAFGMAVWLTMAGVGGKFVVSSYNASSFYSPILANMAVSAISGSLVMPAVGWYKPWADPPAEVKDLFSQLGISPPKGFYRDGGHVMVLAMAKGSAGQAQLVGVRDPAAPNDGAVFYQSAFSTDEYPVVDSLDYFNGYLRLQSRVKDLGSNAFLDGYFAITPKYGLTVQGNTLFWLKPFFLFNEDGFSAPIVESFRSPFPGVIVDIAIHPEGTRHPYLVEGDNTIWQIDTLTGASTRFATVDNPRRIVFGGPEQKLYVLLPKHVISLGLDGRQDARVLLDGPLADIAYDEAGDRLVGLSRRDDELVLFHADLGPEGKIPLPGFTCDGSVSLAYEPQSGAVLVHCGHSSRVLRVRLDEGRRGTVEAVELQAARDPLGLTADDEGHLFVSDGGLLVEYDRSGGLVAGSAFTGLPAGESLDVLRAFNNFDPRTMDNFLYRNVLPEDSGR